jgi:hypothetical protein
LRGEEEGGWHASPLRLDRVTDGYEDVHGTKREMDLIIS